ncbi:UDP-N-acetylglucosamine 2-epimerase [Halobacteriovorax marinus]|uniref:UDP-N-acetylglucosamine 2-epimerase n=1 Tax=Halobacteriovorax marinus TaxID=97084 RepID=A0A1Y5FB27_9BACT|nr:UDP-N-acetylglucosamine 2-epimerase [Halobacteriovorax marinus]
MTRRKLKVLTLVGTRPEIIKLSRIFSELEENVEHVLVHSGQNFDYELNEIFFKDLGIKKPDHFLEAVGSSTAETIGNIITKFDVVIEKEKPDAFLIYGDTNSCLAIIAAKKRKVPIFHMEAGNRCFDQRVPEEVNRKIVDHLSDINMVHSEHARRYLLNEGISPDTIIKTGSPMVEIFDHYKSNIEESNVLNDLSLEADNYFVVSVHREENVDSEENFNNFLQTLEELAAEYKKRIIVSTHPRTRIKLEKLNYTAKNSLIEFMKPLGFFDYIKLQKSAFCTISDSGTITEESSILKFPAITIRQAHERPEGMDRATVIMSELYADAVIRSIALVKNQDTPTMDIPDYDATDVSKKVLRIIYSYTDFVNRTVWHK